MKKKLTQEGLVAKGEESIDQSTIEKAAGRTKHYQFKKGTGSQILIQDVKKANGHSSRKTNGINRSNTRNLSESQVKFNSSMEKVFEVLKGRPILKKTINLSHYKSKKSIASERMFQSILPKKNEDEGIEKKMAKMDMTKSVFVAKKNDFEPSEGVKMSKSVIKVKEEKPTVRKTIERSYVGVMRSSIICRESIDKRPKITRRIKI